VNVIFLPFSSFPGTDPGTSSNRKKGRTEGREAKGRKRGSDDGRITYLERVQNENKTK